MTGYTSHRLDPLHYLPLAMAEFRDAGERLQFEIERRVEMEVGAVEAVVDRVERGERWAPLIESLRGDSELWEPA